MDNYRFQLIRLPGHIVEAESDDCEDLRARATRMEEAGVHWQIVERLNYSDTYSLVYDPSIFWPPANADAPKP